MGTTLSSVSMVTFATGVARVVVGKAPTGAEGAGGGAKGKTAIYKDKDTQRAILTL